MVRLSKRWLFTPLMFLGLIVLTSTALAQEEPAFEQAELDQALAPIALYPDTLLSQILMASTYPVDVAEAAQWSKANPDQQGDAAVTAVSGKPWDPSVQSLTAFPQVLDMMGGQPEWVQSLGDAFLAQPDDVMDTVQALRNRAQDEGNLESNEQTAVSVDTQTTQETIIIVEPADPQIIYVPSYNPTIVYGPWWWSGYRPPFYWPPPPGYALVSGISFGIGIAITNSLWGGFNWGRNDIDIDINRYNNININRRLDVEGKRTSWKHDPKHRRGVPYADAKSRESFGNARAGSSDRDAYRGRESDRDASRDRAREALTERGADPAEARKALRDNKEARAQAQQATKNLKGNEARAKAQKIDHNKAKKKMSSRRKDNALSGAGNGARARAQSQRGRSSHRNGGGGRKRRH